MQMKTVRAELKFELPDLDAEQDEDYPDQMAEYRVQLLERAIVSFVGQIVDGCTVCEEEHNVVWCNIAMKMLESFRSRASSELLKKRLTERYPLKQQEKL